jgi:hypothetical protein
MTTKQKKPATQAANIDVKMQPGESEAAAVARILLHPSVSASLTIQNWNSMSQPVDQAGLFHALNKQSEQAIAGDLSRGEAILMSQAFTLDAIFNKLAVLARQNLFQNLEAGDTLLRLALRAQAQCRATIETLAETKYPTGATFVRQANIAHGPQQVNNAPQTPVARAGAIGIPPNKLLEQTYGERLDIVTSGQTVCSDPAMAPVGAIDRAKDRYR